ncbi:hypothetical protein GLAREA_09320 [Glarea lozoyensis ATCC 20868]|uniref:Uncharacterized protein n=1 Tax=Glarea lozoyensis (strain ATCC 20868 / MF5171) TaxID=1116229 RepID=S3DFG7_GLAL2|nr:uncharacterized protein GLAREA_09320 [Glarea lozoyensis ATCC 20868]EPE37157.1 hypothetical protein GLAREA_09320 [Glarea lozoyensis ATCC 20868]
MSTPNIPDFSIELPRCQSCRKPSHLTICKQCGTEIKNIDGREYRGMRMYEWVMGESNEGKERGGSQTTSVSNGSLQSSSSSNSTMGQPMGGAGRIVKRSAIGRVKKMFTSWKGIGK